MGGAQGTYQNPNYGVPYASPDGPGFADDSMPFNASGKPDEDDEGGLPSWFPRSMTAEVTNDPRVFNENVIEKRFSAFEAIVVAAVLLAGSSCGALLETRESESTSPFTTGYLAVWLYLVCFSCNMVAVLILTMQYYQAYRLMTAGSTGFETCKEYYMNPSVNELRHMAAKLFFWSIPMFVIAMGVEMLHRMSVVRAWPLVATFCVMAFIMAVVIAHHGVIFRMKYMKSKAFEQQQFAALDRMSPMRTGYTGWNVSGV
jgi:hypothetical protein